MNSEQESVSEYEFGDSDQRCIAELLTGSLSSELQEVQEQGVNSEQESVSEYEFGDSDQDV